MSWTANRLWLLNGRLSSADTSSSMCSARLDESKDSYDSSEDLINWFQEHASGIQSQNVSDKSVFCRLTLPNKNLTSDACF